MMFFNFFGRKCFFAVICSFVLLISLSSCSGAINKLLGIKDIDYESETVIGNAAERADVVSELSGIISALTVNSNILPEFSDPGSAVSKCSDAVLNYMLATNYAKYNGNVDLLKKAEKKYPNMNITSAIEISDYEDTLYKLFNYGESAKKADTERFRYLSKISAFIPSAQAKANDTVLDITSLEETSNTYRMTFYVILDENISRQYFALFIKREKGSCYIKTLRSVASGRVNAPQIDVFS